MARGSINKRDLWLSNIKLIKNIVFLNLSEEVVVLE